MEARQPIQVGVDLRPIPIRLREGEEWEFNADPPKEFFAEITNIGKTMQQEDQDTNWDGVDMMRSVLASQILDEDARQDFIDQNYGLAALSGIAKAYAETVVAVPTGSPSPSGRGQGSRGTGR